MTAQLYPFIITGQFNGQNVIVRTTVLAMQANGISACNFVPLVIAASPQALEKHGHTIATICSSIVINPKWVHGYMLVCAQLTQRPAPSDPEVKEETNAEQKSFDHANEDWDKYIRGTVDVHDDETGTKFVGENDKTYWKSANGITTMPYGQQPRDISNYTQLRTH
jgi:hypothetical protein